MKSALFLATSLGLLLCAGSAGAAVTTYTVTLNGAQEVGPVTTAATGTGTLSFDDGNKMLTGTVTYSGLSGNPTAAHIHQAACGTNGGAVVTLAASGGTINVSTKLTDAQATALIAGDLYVNIHTAANGGGEIRGQIYAQSSGMSCPPGSGSDAGSSSGDADGGSSSGSSGTSSSGSSGTSSSGSSGTSSGSSGNSSGSNGATTTRPSDGSSTAPAAEDDGCSTTGSAPGSGLAIALGVGVALAAMSKRRRKA